MERAQGLLSSPAFGEPPGAGGSLEALDTHVLPSVNPALAGCLPLQGLPHDSGGLRAQGRARPCSVLKRKWIFKTGQRAFFKLANWVSLAPFPYTGLHMHAYSHISDFPTNKQSIISVTAQNVLFRLTRAKRDDPRLHHEMHFQEELDDTGASSHSLKAPSNHY